MTENYQLVIEKEKGRLDKVIAEKIKDLSRTKIKELVNDKNILVNNKAEKVSYKVQAGDLIDITVPPAKPLSLEAQNLNLDIVYEDADVIVVNKPQGMVVHPSAGHPDHTLVNGLLYHTHELADSPEGFRPGIVHRIDKDTTGALLVCKTDLAHRDLAQQLKEHSITRRYRAIVHGNLKEEEGTIEGAIGRHPTERKKMAINLKNGKPAVTHYKVLEHYKNYSYIECRLETGRTHQIRVHMSSIGHPLVGDFVYGPKKCPFPNLEGQTLHAMVLGFVHPVTKEYLEFTAPLPQYFEKLQKKLI